MQHVNAPYSGPCAALAQFRRAKYQRCNHLLAFDFRFQHGNAVGVELGMEHW